MLKYILPIMLLASPALAYKTGDLVETDYICLDENVIITVGKAIDENRKEDAEALIQKSVDDKKCFGKDGNMFRAQLVDRLWDGLKNEIWSVTPIGKTEPTAYIGMQKKDKKVDN